MPTTSTAVILSLMNRRDGFAEQKDGRPVAAVEAFLEQRSRSAPHVRIRGRRRAESRGSADFSCSALLS